LSRDEKAGDEKSAKRRYTAQSDSEQVKTDLIQPKATKTWGV